MHALALLALTMPAPARDWGVDFGSDPTILTDPDTSSFLTPLADNRGTSADHCGHCFGEAATGVGDHSGDGVHEIAVDLSLRGERTTTPPHSGIVYVCGGRCEDADGDGVCEFDDCDESDPTIPSETDALFDGVGLDRRGASPVTG